MTRLNLCPIPTTSKVLALNFTPFFDIKDNRNALRKPLTFPEVRVNWSKSGNRKNIAA